MLEQPVEQGGSRRWQAEILALGRPLPSPGHAHERPRDDPRDSMLTLEQLAGGGARGVQLRRAVPCPSCAATWKTLSADVYTIHLPVRRCSSPNWSSTRVPEAGRFPSTPRPVRRANSSITSVGKPSG